MTFLSNCQTRRPTSLGRDAVTLLGCTIAFAIASAPRSASAQRTAAPRTATASATARAAATPAGPDIFLVPLSAAGGVVKAGVPANLTHRVGYDNQPAFSADSKQLFYTSNRGDGQSDIYRYDFNTGLATPARLTKPESEYSAFAIDSGKALAVIRVEADSTQRLWRVPLDGAAPSVLFADLKPVGYFAQANDSLWAMFVLGSPTTLHVATMGRPGSTVVARNIGRSLHRIPGTSRVSFVQKGADAWYVMQLDPATRRIDTLVKTLPRVEDLAWMDSTTMLMGQGTQLFSWRRGTADWTPVADFAFAHIAGISRLAVSPSRQWLAMVADVTPRTAAAARAVFTDRFDAATIQKQVDNF